MYEQPGQELFLSGLLYFVPITLLEVGFMERPFKPGSVLFRFLLRNQKTEVMGHVQQMHLLPCLPVEIAK
ncbi:hypothetical protein Pla110_11040 [Polystyrenella longa]|uniref:Uncharacterized protein n=1 Tax=Polystyrenella longa TaxID=2528007 RepID=A0A518CJI6_9PLAN|nr:hypothetical protein Pla110_11040 [Polystyrenella longa]